MPFHASPLNHFRDHDSTPPDDTCNMSGSRAQSSMQHNADDAVEWIHRFQMSFCGPARRYGTRLDPGIIACQPKNHIMRWSSPATNQWAFRSTHETHFLVGPISPSATVRTCGPHESQWKRYICSKSSAEQFHRYSFILWLCISPSFPKILSF